MNFVRGLGILTVAAALILGDPARVVADHCGALATVSPSWGPPGTTFVFRTNLGAPSDLYLSRDGELEKMVYLSGNGFIRYSIKTRSGDVGSWKARAEVRGSPNCAAEARFSVGYVPDTDVATVADTVDAGPWPERWPGPLVMASIALASFWIALRRLRGGRGSTGP